VKAGARTVPGEQRAGIVEDLRLALTGPEMLRRLLTEGDVWSLARRWLG
jgi:hypothetical protein